MASVSCPTQRRAQPPSPGQLTTLPCNQFLERLWLDTQVLSASVSPLLSEAIGPASPRVCSKLSDGFPRYPDPDP